MNAASLEIPAEVLGKARVHGAEQWISDLPDLIASLERDWSIQAGQAYPGSTEALVTRATLADGTPAVLKLCVPYRGETPERQAAVLRLVNGEGCAKLLRDDPARGAMLLERLGRPMSALDLPIEQRHELLCAAAERIWRPAPQDCGLRDGASTGHWLVDYITATWEELDRPCSEQAVDYALDCAARRAAAHDDERAVLLHGDLHQWNALEAGDGTFKLVDPDGVLAEAEYELSVIMREDPVELMTGDPRDRARWLARRCGLDATAIWEWGVVERVSTGLLCTNIGLQPVGRQMLAAAEHIAAHHARG
ncbi:MAG TPA: aminoglycoside phosphotransferase family protein [Streptosporangiaceae bacterium]